MLKLAEIIRESDARMAEWEQRNARTCNILFLILVGVVLIAFSSADGFG